MEPEEIRFDILCCPFCMGDCDMGFPLFVLPFDTGTCFLDFDCSQRTELLRQ